MSRAGSGTGAGVAVAGDVVLYRKAPINTARASAIGEAIKISRFQPGARPTIGIRMPRRLGMNWLEENPAC